MTWGRVGASAWLTPVRDLSAAPGRSCVRLVVLGGRQCSTRGRQSATRAVPRVTQAKPVPIERSSTDETGGQEVRPLWKRAEERDYLLSSACRAEKMAVSAASFCCTNATFSGDTSFGSSFSAPLFCIIAANIA